MKNLRTYDLEIINGGGDTGDLDGLLSCGTMAALSLGVLATGPASIPIALGATALFNAGLIGSAVSATNWISK